MVRSSRGSCFLICLLLLLTLGVGACAKKPANPQEQVVRSFLTELYTINKDQRYDKLQETAKKLQKERDSSSVKPGVYVDPQLEAAIEAYAEPVTAYLTSTYKKTFLANGYLRRVDEQWKDQGVIKVQEIKITKKEESSYGFAVILTGEDTTREVWVQKGRADLKETQKGPRIKNFWLEKAER